MNGDVEIEPTEALRTWNVGDMAGKKESETIPMRQKLIKYPEEKAKGGEPFQDFLDRYRPELEKIIERRANGENVSMVAHGHQLLAAKHILTNEEVDPKNLPSLDEINPPGSVFGFWKEKNGDIRVEELE
jgi:broad specificity phosphatase PhoE